MKSPYLIVSGTIRDPRSLWQRLLNRRPLSYRTRVDLSEPQEFGAMHDPDAPIHAINPEYTWRQPFSAELFSSEFSLSGNILEITRRHG